MKISRDELLKILELAQFGIPPRETVSFSKSFLFQNGEVLSYNDEILCRAKLPKAKAEKGNPWKNINGAVDAQRLLGILRKIPDPEISLEQKNGEMVLSVDKKKGSFRVENLDGVDLPSDQVEEAKEFTSLDPSFGEAVGLVQDCAKEKDSTFSRTCVYITKENMQAYDNFQMIRRDFASPIKSDYILVRKEAIKHLATLGMDKLGETDNWVHFKNKTGLTYSCRRWLEEYPDLSPYLDRKGEPIVLPKGLEEIIDRANEFSQELADANRVKVEIKNGRVLVTGQGITGKYEEWRDLDNYKGEEFAFLISPGLLTNIVKKSLQVQLSASELIVNGDGWKYLAVLVNPDEVDMLDELDEEEEEQEAEVEDEE